MIVPNQQMLDELTMMGFSVELIKKALIKVKNASMEAALDAIMEIQASEEK